VLGDLLQFSSLVPSRNAAIVVLAKEGFASNAGVPVVCVADPYARTGLCRVYSEETNQRILKLPEDEILVGGRKTVPLLLDNSNGSTSSPHLS